ncbi:MAG: hypothetical protein HC927_05245 [Deltaproteobacteria bacterium]|nr:hypothetical protein [Deltaproteobacteria bacterium]
MPVLLTSLASIHGVCMALGHYADAETYADAGTQVSAEVLNPFANADLFEARGDAQFAGGKPSEAVASYQRCRELCRTYQYFHRWQSVLGKLGQIYVTAAMWVEQRELADELALAKELERRGGKEHDS